MDKGEMMSILNEAFQHELINSMVYMRNAFLMGPGEDRRLTEWIGIDEMRHMNWLGDLITARGGVPTMEHRELDFGGNDPTAFLERQIVLETEAIEMYKDALERCASDAEVVGVLNHILDEEKRHRVEFRKLLSAIKGKY